MHWTFSLYIFIWLLITELLIYNGVVVVTIEDGSLMGEERYTILKHTTYYSFKGIPYAAPPTGLLRFKDPQPVRKWGKTKFAKKHGNICPQVDVRMLLKNLTETDIEILGHENCLFLNVYTPSLPTSENTLKPVMFFIHGGGFWTGSGDDYLYGPDFLIEDDVVLVTINYRLGALGFLSLENKEIPGNFGMKDQVFALKWVQRNIAAFGGDPKRVTIFGQEAGGASTSLLMLSPLARGLFHNVISQSGSSINAWAINSGSMRKKAVYLANLLGHTNSSTKDLTKFFRSVSSEMLAKYSDFRYYNNFDDSKDYSVPAEFIFSPTIEPEDSSWNAFLTVDPVVTLKQASYVSLPALMGYTSEEFLIYRNTDYDFSTEFSEIMMNQRIKFPFRNCNVSISHPNHLQLVNALRQFSHINITRNIPRKILDINSDIWFKFGVEAVVRFLAELSSKNTYFYEFSYQGAFNLVSQHRNTDGSYKTEVSGTSNGDELCYQFKCRDYIESYKELGEYSLDYRMIKIWSKLFTNFAKTGNPTPTRSKLLRNVIWRPRKITENNFLKITENMYSGEYIQGSLATDYWIILVSTVQLHLMDHLENDNVIMITFENANFTRILYNQ